MSPEELFAGKLRAARSTVTDRLWETSRLRRMHVALAVTLPHPLYGL
ncbi:MAG: hypothetical protein AB1560_13765 [Pseudomonadota bacterium]